MSEVAKAEVISVDNEAEERFRLLDLVVVNEQGVAVCEDPASGGIMKLAASGISDGSDARHLPFEKADGGGVALGVPGDKPTQIGFFVGHEGQGTVGGVLRIGEYPGQPLVTAQIVEGLNKEIMIRLKGIKDSELDERRWAEQVGLFEALDFDPDNTRAVFSKVHREKPDSDAWDEQRILVLPQSMDDLVETVDPDVRGDVYQVMGYETAAAKPLLPPPSDVHFGMYGRGATRGGGEAATPMTSGFGKSYETKAQLGSISVVGLQGAFEVNIVPES